MPNNIEQDNQQQQPQETQLGNTMSRANNSPDLTQNQPENMPFGQGQGIMDPQQIPNVTRKVQYAAEGNDPFSQLISAGDMMIHNAGQDYGSGTIIPDHYDIINKLYDMGTGVKNFVQSGMYEKNQVRPNTTNDRLNQRFSGNIEDFLGNQKGRTISQSVEDMNMPYDPNIYLMYDGVVEAPTRDLITDYRTTLNSFRDPNEPHFPNELHTLRLMHNELARRGINTDIFNHGHSDDEIDASIANQLRDHNNRYHIFTENPDDFHRRTMGTFSYVGTPPSPRELERYIDTEQGRIGEVAGPRRQQELEEENRMMHSAADTPEYMALRQRERVAQRRAEFMQQGNDRLRDRRITFPPPPLPPLPPLNPALDDDVAEEYNRVALETQARAPEEEPEDFSEVSEVGDGDPAEEVPAERPAGWRPPQVRSARRRDRSWGGIEPEAPDEHEMEEVPHDVDIDTLEPDVPEPAPPPLFPEVEAQEADPMEQLRALMGPRTREQIMMEALRRARGMPANERAAMISNALREFDQQ